MSPRNTDLPSLPLYAQALIASRLARRAALAMLTGPALEAAIASCDAIDHFAQAGDGFRDDHPLYRNHPRGNTPHEALHWAWDSLAAAHSSSDFPIDPTVTASARRAIAAVTQDPRVSAIQVAILLAADIDQTHFACQEASISKYAGLTPHVLARLAPCHPLTLSDPRRNPEDDFR